MMTPKGIITRTMIVHTVTYFIAGLIAFSVFNYSASLSEPGLSSLMHPVDDPLVQAGVLFQPIRGVLFGAVFLLLADSIFKKRQGWIMLWFTLVVLGIFSTFGPAPESIEGFIYTRRTFDGLWGRMVEVLAQSFVLATLTFYGSATRRSAGLIKLSASYS
jgi:hypothetical protein